MVMKSWSWLRAVVSPTANGIDLHTKQYSRTPADHMSHGNEYLGRACITTSARWPTQRGN